jgi:hypothetical protein
MDIFGRHELYSFVVSVYMTCLVLCVAFIVHYGFDSAVGVLASLLGVAGAAMSCVKVTVALRSERGRYARPLDDETVVLTSLDQSELDKIESIDMIAKMFESDYTDYT